MKRGPPWGPGLNPDVGGPGPSSVPGGPGIVPAPGEQGRSPKYGERFFESRNTSSRPVRQEWLQNQNSGSAQGSPYTRSAHPTGATPEDRRGRENGGDGNLARGNGGRDGRNGNGGAETEGRERGGRGAAGNGATWNAERESSGRVAESRGQNERRENGERQDVGRQNGGGGETIVVGDSVVVMRKERDLNSRLRRGSLKSRFFQFKRRKKEDKTDRENLAPGGGRKQTEQDLSSPGSPANPGLQEDQGSRQGQGLHENLRSKINPSLRFDLETRLDPGSRTAPGSRMKLDSKAEQGFRIEPVLRISSESRMKPENVSKSRLNPEFENKFCFDPNSRLATGVISKPESEVDPLKRHNPSPRYEQSLLNPGSLPSADFSGKSCKEPQLLTLTDPNQFPIYSQPRKKFQAPRLNKENVSPSSPLNPRSTPDKPGVSVLSEPKPIQGSALPQRPTRLVIPPSSNRRSDLIRPPSSSLASSPICKDVEVILRSRSSPGQPGSKDPGRLLKSALSRHFRNLHCGASHRSSGAPGEIFNAGTVLSLGLDHYIQEIFNQLDYNHTGLVTRDDFLILCEILELSKSPPQSKRNSGIEWLSSYRPRPNSPGSPLRVDKLADVQFKHSGPKPPERDSTSFLWTIGPRPFWELWPQKKRRKKQLNLEDFTKYLLEQWAKTYGYPLSSIGDNAFTGLRDQIGFFETNDVPDTIVEPATVQFNLKQDETRSRRLIRSIVRVSRRYHILERISRRLHPDHAHPVAEVEGDTQNGFNLVTDGNRRHFVNGNRGNVANGNGTSAANGNRLGPRVPPTHPEPMFRRGEPNPEQNGSSRPQKRFSKILRFGETEFLQQQEQLHSLREVIEDLRSSLQLSDAQNLALQVSLRKMNKAGEGRKDGRGSIEESEKQLENLVRELKKMSETEYPTISSQLSSSTPGPEHSSSYTPPGWEEDLEKTVSTLTSASRGLSSAQLELRHTALRLKPNTSSNGGHEHTNLEKINETLNEEKNMKNYGEKEKEERRSVERNGENAKEKKETDEERRNEIIEEAFSALQRAEEEIKHLRLSLEAAQESLEKSRVDLDTSQQEFFNLHTRLKQSENKLSSVEQRAAQLSQNRRSLLCELQSTKEVLLSSLNKVQDLELDSRQVPVLQARVQELERRILVSRRFEGKLRPMSTIDSGLYSTDSTDSDQDPEKVNQGGWEDEGYSVRDQGLPPRPPSSRSRDKSPRSNTPSSGASEKSPRSNTPSSGHHSAGSKLSSSSIQSQNTVSPNTGESGIPRLRREIETLKKKYNQAEQEWVQERGCLIQELSRRKDDFGEISSDLQVLEAERFRLSLLEDKIKEVLNMLRTLNSMRIGQRALGKLVIQAVDQSVDPVLGDIQVFKFLSCLYHSTREYERLAADSMLTRALEAVEDGEEEDESDSDSSESLTNIPEEMGTIRPRRVRVDQPNQTFTIDV